jgi:methionine-rich copper-binding protein CopC
VLRQHTLTAVANATAERALLKQDGVSQRHHATVLDQVELYHQDELDDLRTRLKVLTTKPDQRSTGTQTDSVERVSMKTQTDAIQQIHHSTQTDEDPETTVSSF